MSVLRFRIYLMPGINTCGISILILWAYPTISKTEYTKMADLPEQILLLVKDKNGIGTDEVARTCGCQHQNIVGAVKSLQALGNVSYVSLRQFCLPNLTSVKA